MAKIFQIAEFRKSIRPQSIAGASEKLRDRYQSGRIVDQFLLRPEPKAIAAREQVTTRQVLAIVRDRLAAKEAA